MLDDVLIKLYSIESESTSFHPLQLKLNESTKTVPVSGDTEQYPFDGGEFAINST